MQRIPIRNEFIRRFAFCPEDLNFLASDMSLRQYYRLNKAGTPGHILMDAPKPENPEQFIRIAHYLKGVGLRAPEIIGQDLDVGFVLLEDFGDQTFTKVLKQTPEVEEGLLTMAVNVLKYLHQNAIVQPPDVPLYSVQKLVAEVGVFIDWYWPFVTGSDAPLAIKQDFMERWQLVFESMPPVPSSLVLRDYHVDNLMVLESGEDVQKCGLLDFQDALWGSVVYDFISLIEDARCDTTPSLINGLWQLFLDTVPENDHANYREAATILGAGRHTKVLGIFTRAAMRGGNSNYLCHISRLWGYLDRSFDTCPALGPIRDWFNLHAARLQLSI
ncbi:MAG: phosphotransferase [Alphaproteobacteria bacterium]|nr:phosphotransferase [Alphaproteobacteria bacterium]